MTATSAGAARAARHRGPLRLVYVVTHPITAHVLLAGQLEGMRGEGFDVTVVSSPGAELGAVGSREGVATVSVPMARAINPVADAVALARLLRVFRARRPDLVNAGTPKAGLLGMIAARITRVPVRIYTLRGLRLETTTGATRSVLAATEWVAAACAHRVVCVSASVRARMIDLGLARAAKSLVLGPGSSNGVDTQRFRPAEPAERAQARSALGLPPDACVVGFVGRFTRDKGIEDLLGAFTRVVVPAVGSARLLLIGDFEEGDAVPAAVRERLRDTPGVHFAGFVSDTAPCYRAMDVLAFPSYREGFPNAPLEAAASGLPIIGYAATGTVDAVVDGVTGTLVPVGDADALGAALRDTLGDYALRAAHGHAGRKRVVREFRREVVWARWAAFYREMFVRRGLVPDLATRPVAGP
jgi:glycosyltransferase involved in cell wall biosynthesis